MQTHTDRQTNTHTHIFTPTSTMGRHQLSAVVTVLWLCCVCTFIFSVNAYHEANGPVYYCNATAEREQPTHSKCLKQVQMYADRLTSEQTLIPYAYDSFDFCQITQSHKTPENLGQVLMGDRIMATPYKFAFGVDEECIPVCNKNYTLGRRGGEDTFRKMFPLADAIRHGYRHNWIIDNMSFRRYMYWGSYFNNEIGCSMINGQCYHSNDLRHTSIYGSYRISNHADITIKYQRLTDGRFLIVGGQIEHSSYRDIGECLEAKKPRPYDGIFNKWDYSRPRIHRTKVVHLDAVEDFNITYSYSVHYQSSYSKWHKRWTIYDDLNRFTANWVLSFVISGVVSLLLASFLVCILLRTFRRDCLISYDLVNWEPQENFGWKPVAEDMFKPPRMGRLLCVLLGSGVQIFIMTIITMCFGAFGLLSPASRGALMTCIVTLYVLLGFVAGYVSARMYKSFGGKSRLSLILLTSFLIPGTFFAIYMIQNVVLWSKHSSAAVPLPTLVAVIALWLCAMIPLVFGGSYFGFRAKAIEFPLYSKLTPPCTSMKLVCKWPFIVIIMSGGVLFGCVVAQLFLILMPLWTIMYLSQETYGKLIGSLLLFMVACGELGVLVNYCQLGTKHAEKWWWRPFVTSAVTSLGIFIYFICFLTSFGPIGFKGGASVFLYLSYSVMMIIPFFLLSSMVGFFASFFFMLKIYHSISEKIRASSGMQTESLLASEITDTEDL